jgi:hypothetical protein
MTRACDIIASSADRSVGEVLDLFIAYGLGAGIELNDDVSWKKLPLGTGSDLISFMKSGHYKPEGASYGQLARQWLGWRMNKFN